MNERMKRIIDEDAYIIANSDLNWEKLKNKTVLISGANGYVPQYFVHGFMKRNDIFKDSIKVVALCRNKDRADERFSEYYGRTDFKLLIQDVCEKINYDDKVDYIIHAASPAGTVNRYENLLATFDANVLGCRNLLEMARKNAAQFLLISSIDIYGKNNTGERLKETSYGVLDPLNVRNIYSCSKRTAETLCACYSKDGVLVKIIRPSQILAGGIALDDGRLHIDFISQMLKGNQIVLKGDGTPRRTFLYITDAITGMLLVLTEGKTGEAYNLCSENGEASVLELARIMASCVQDREIDIIYNMETRNTDPAVTQVISNMCGSSDKIHELGWSAHVSLQEACRRMMKYYGLFDNQ